MSSVRQQSGSSSGSSSSDFLLVDAVPIEECIVTKLNRRSFVEDLISKSFPLVLPSDPSTAPKQQEQAAEDDEEETLCLDSDLGNIGNVSPIKAPAGRGAFTSSTSSDSETAFRYDAAIACLVSDDIWPRVYRQFELDVGRQTFMVESQQFRKADEAYSAIRQVMHGALVHKILHERRLRENGVVQQAWNFVSPILGRGLLRHIGQAARLSRMFAAASGQAARADPEYDDEELYSEALQRAADRMSRLVVLLSQQSVMGLPYEELYHKYLASMHRVLYLDADGASGNGAMRVQLATSPVGVDDSDSSFSVISASSPGANAPSHGGATTRIPPPPLFRRSQHNNSTSSCCSSDAATSGDPMIVPTLRVHKRFRVFELPDDNAADQTLYFIDTELVVDLFASESVPILMVWNVTSPSPRRYSTKTAMTEAVVASAAASQEDADTSESEAEIDNAVDASVSSERITYIPPETSARLFSTEEARQSPLPSSSAGETPRESNNAPSIISVSASCECLGGSYGFHRETCSHVARYASLNARR